ncbi:hypothetical protein ACT3SP_15395 [Brachybacterium sp. AOP43-C2-M15]|uniref:hypothetical protein n=1 Tax=Brachybacterium sp. AOP43-C2-M15 TaxID=3457661 RepID=UPI004034CEDC
MSSPYARPTPPLTDLPAPRRLPREATTLVPPTEIMVESKSVIRRRLLRILWAPGLVLLGLWYLLLVLYVSGASPTFWFFSLLASLGEPIFLRRALTSLGFTSTGVGTAFLLVPAIATGLSLALAPLAPSLLTRLQPRRHLSEKAFQRAVATLVTAVLMLPPVVVVAVLPLTLVLGLPQPWSGLGAGPLSSWCLGILALQLGWILVRRTISPARLLGITDADMLRTTARIGTDPEERRAAAKQVLAQDRRHLPPNPGTAAASAAWSPRGAATALALIARASLVWVLPAAAGLGWLVFGITDVVTVILGMTTMDLNSVSTPLRLAPFLLALPVAGLVLFAVALSPALAVLLAEGQRDQVRDQRTYEDWNHRARVNPWEARVAALTGWLSAAWALLGTAVLAVLLQLLQLATALTWVGIVVIALALVPLLGAAAAFAMRSGLRDVLYGPAGDYTRREAPYALIATDIGTRTDRGKDPAVRAELRKRLQAEGGDHALALFDIDAAGERLWVDDSAPGATDTEVREADLVRGALPDFGSEGSAFTGGGLAGPEAEQEVPRHDIPDSVTGLREPR